MASPSLRSSGRSEGSNTSTRSSRKNPVATSPKQNSILKTQESPNIGRKKRQREPAGSNESEEKAISNKKARFSVEIPSPPKPLQKNRSLVNKSNAKTDVVLQKSAPPPKQPLKARSAQAPPTLHKPNTNHHEKVVNGIRHELDRLGPSKVDAKDSKRKLRSQESTRFKSELSAYFPDYDEIIGNELKEDHPLNLDTPLAVGEAIKTLRSPQLDYSLVNFSQPNFSTLNEAHRVNFSFLDSHKYKEDEEEDPLIEEHYGSIHRKPERQEKTIRNTDKGRAQHEKDQVIRLLEGLQGHDWLKLMGVSGITESKKKEYEPARVHFIKGCQGLLEKFRTWREEEKRRKLEKDMAMAEAEAEEDAETEHLEGEEEDNGNISDGDPPDYSDVDASAARQLHDEAIAQSAPLQTSQAGSRRRVKVEAASPTTYPMEKDFTSFFAKPHLRPTEVKKTRRSGRSTLPWGQPIPELSDVEFDLPEEFRDEETLKAHARQKRRDRRVGKE